MKSITAFIALLLTAAGAPAQFEKDDWELGMTIAAGSYSETSKSNYDEYYNNANYAAVALMPGYYVTNGFSLEPEFSFYTMEYSDPTFQLSGNLSYTGWIPGQKAAWFARGGIGTGNGVPFPGMNFTLFDTEESIFILNFGAGVKAPISQSVALRTELNYRIYQFTYHPDYNGYSGSARDHDIRDFSLRIGFSILL